MTVAETELPQEVPYLLDLPEHYPVDPATWRALKEQAIRLDVRGPDFLVAASSVPAAAPQASFPGIGFQGLYPPDTHVARSPQRIIEVVNSAVSLFNSQGSLIQTKSLASFFGTSASPLVPFDPRVLFDRLGPNQRYFIIASQYDPGPPARATIFLSVSRNANPQDLNPATWCTYWLYGLDDYGTQYETFADYPMIGVGADALTLSRNHYTIVGSVFTYAVVEVFQKLSLTNNATTCQPAFSRIFRPAATSGDFNTFVLQPVLHYSNPSSYAGTANPVYLVSSRWPSGDAYRLWRLRNVQSGATPSDLQVVSVPAHYCPVEV